MTLWGLDNDFSIVKSFFVNSRVLLLGIATSIFDVAFLIPGDGQGAD